MTQDPVFLQAFSEPPDDGSLGLSSAAWLEEPGQSAWAEFLRVQGGLANLAASDPQRAELEARVRQLLAAHREEWLAALLRLLDRVPWLEHLGQPAARDAEVCRLHDWGGWPGPYEPRTDPLYQFFQMCHDHLLAQAGPFRREAEGLWEVVREAVFRQAKRKVPFDPGQDPWHGPSKAAWDVACWAGLVGVHLLFGRGMPGELGRVWSWVAAGHWPCGYLQDAARGEVRKLLVY